MTHKHLSLLLALLMSMVANVASAYDACIDGIYYNFSGTTATVTYETMSYNSYAGDVIIPEMVEYNDVEYTIDAIGEYAFSESKDLVSISLSKNISYIGLNAFSGCI